MDGDRKQIRFPFFGLFSFSTCTECATNFYSSRKTKITPKRRIFENAPIDTNILGLLLSYRRERYAAHRALR